jgi:hypothetical protein
MGNSNSCCSNKRDFDQEQKRNEAKHTYVHKLCLHTVGLPQNTLKQVITREGSQTNFDTQKASFTEGRDLVIFDIWSKHALFGKDIQG